MNTKVFLITALAAVFITAGAALSWGHMALEDVEIDLSPQSIKKGEEVFMSTCRTCHGLKYYKTKVHPKGIAPLMDPKSAAGAFGKAPPDLSLIAKARGKGLEGAVYVYNLLTSYYKDESGKPKNKTFAAWTQGDGTIAMPQPIASDDPELKEKAKAVAAYLFHVAEPSYNERRSLGRFVLLYMVVLTTLLYLVNKKTWKGIKKK